MTEKVICEQCKRPFQPRSGAKQKNKYCSRSCYVASRGTVRHTYTCRNCQAPFSVTAAALHYYNKRGSTPEFCTLTCRSAFLASTRPTTVKIKRASTAKKVTLTCEHCGKDYQRSAAIVKHAIAKGTPPRFCSRQCHARQQFSPITRFPLNATLRQEVLAKTGNRCWYCGSRLRNDATAHADHVIPRAKGGTNDLDNLVPACRSCNSKKRDLSLDEFRAACGGGSFWYESEDHAA